jgi:putative NIF3 family GTP cyclohydrolase 1 type 2
MGLVTDNTDEINYVYTAVFPSPSVIEKIIADDKRNTLLFLHHPLTWDVTKSPAFESLPEATLEELKKRKISMYNLHVPLDANGPYGTTFNFAKAAGVTMTDEFYEYGGVKIGIIGKTEYATVHEIKKHLESAVGHEVKLYLYGESEIKDGLVGLVAGGGNDAERYSYLHEKGINTYLTGVAIQKESFPPSIVAHDTAKKFGINIISGTHYSTEKFACIEMVKYFSELGIGCEFIADTPMFEDM